MKNNEIVVKHNKLIEAKYNLTLVEAKIFSKLISMNFKDDNNFLTYKFKILDLLKEFGMNKKNYSYLRNATKKMISRVVEIETETTLTQFSLLSEAEYGLNTGVLTLKIHKKLKSYLLQLKGHFTKYELQNILQLKSFYSIRLYELLKQYETISYRVFEIKELKSILGIEKKYKLYADLKKYVILQAQKELKTHTDIKFKFEEIKTGRKITAIKFIILTNKKNVVRETNLLKDNCIIAEYEVIKEPANNELSKLKKLIKNGDLRDISVENLLKKYLKSEGYEYCKYNLIYCLDQYDIGKVKNFLGYLYQALEQNYAKDIIEKLKKEYEAKKINEQVKNLTKEEIIAIKLNYFNYFSEEQKNWHIEQLKTERLNKRRIKNGNFNLENALEMYCHYTFNIYEILKWRNKK